MENLKEHIIKLVEIFAPQGDIVDENYDIQQRIDSLSIVSFLLTVEDELKIGRAHV